MPLRANQWIQKHPAEAQKIPIDGTAREGVTPSADAARQDDALRRLFRLDQQIGPVRGAALVNPSYLEPIKSTPARMATVKKP